MGFLQAGQYSTPASGGGGGGSGTVTSIAAGFGVNLAPNPITTTGSVSVDTTALSGLVQIVATGQTTAAMAAGLVGYVNVNNTWARTSNLTLATSRAGGVFEGTAGSVQLTGVSPDAAFTTAGGLPAPGAPVYLAASTDDGGTGAGKLTATAPTSGFLVEFGICLDNANYAGAKTAKVIIQPKQPVGL